MKESKYGKFDRRSQKMLNFRVDSIIRSEFKEICEKHGESMQIKLEKLIKGKIKE